MSHQTHTASILTAARWRWGYGGASLPGYPYLIAHGYAGGYYLYRSGQSLGYYRTLAEAKQAAQSDLGE